MVKIIIPGELTDLNEYIRQERGNKYVAAKTKKNETFAVSLFAREQGKPITHRSKIYFTWFCKNQKKDPDNISFAQKYILDGLVKAGILQGDGWKDIRGLYHDFEIDKDEPRVEIVIYRCGDL